MSRKKKEQFQLCGLEFFLWKCDPVRLPVLPYSFRPSSDSFTARTIRIKHTCHVTFMSEVFLSLLQRTNMEHFWPFRQTYSDQHQDHHSQHWVCGNFQFLYWAVGGQSASKQSANSSQDKKSCNEKGWWREFLFYFGNSSFHFVKPKCTFGCRYIFCSALHRVLSEGWSEDHHTWGAATGGAS